MFMFDHLVMATSKAEEKQLTENQKSPKKKNSVRYPFKFVEKNTTKNLWKGDSKIKYKPQLAEPKVP